MLNNNSTPLMHLRFLLQLSLLYKSLWQHTPGYRGPEKVNQKIFRIRRSQQPHLEIILCSSRWSGRDHQGCSRQRATPTWLARASALSSVLRTPCVWGHDIWIWPCWCYFWLWQRLWSYVFTGFPRRGLQTREPERGSKYEFSSVSRR